MKPLRRWISKRHRDAPQWDTPNAATTPQQAAQHQPHHQQALALASQPPRELKPQVHPLTALFASATVKAAVPAQPLLSPAAIAHGVKASGGVGATDEGLRASASPFQDQAMAPLKLPPMPVFKFDLTPILATLVPSSTAAGARASWDPAVHHSQHSPSSTARVS